MPKSSTSRSAEPNLAKHKKESGKEIIASSHSYKNEPENGPLESAPTKPEAEEVEVLSHAAQRKAKKRKLKELQSDNNDGGEIGSNSSKAKVEPKSDNKPTLPIRQNSIWVGNLSFKTTEEQLKNFFEGVGEITRVHMPKKQVVGQGQGMRGENRGFAYVDFATPEAQLLAITFSEKNLDGRRLLIKNGKQNTSIICFALSNQRALGDDFAGRPDTHKNTAESDKQSTEPSATQNHSTTHSKTAQKILSSQKQPAAQTLFMGNLPFETKEDDIRQMIEGHGLPSDLEEQAKRDGAAKNPGGKPLRWLKKIRMGTFEDSGLCKGWAFLDFLSTAYATAVLINPRNHYLNGRKLVLEYGSPDAVRRGGGGPRPRKQIAEEEPAETAREAKRRKYAATNEQAEEGDDIKQEPRSRKPKGDEQYVRAKDGRLRPRPGAALAQAKRETVAIVPSSGKKIVF